MPYNWGSKTFIPALIGLTSPASRPMAEIWMGAHLKAPSRVRLGKREVSLSKLIQKTPEAVLGKAVAERFANRLPFLFKILSVAKPLSIQAHPNQEQARQGYARENDLKIPLEAFQRNYLDENHKPEIVCALGSFWGLIGFRPFKQTVALLKRNGLNGLVKEFAPQHQDSEPEVLQRFFKHLISLDKKQQRELVREALQKIRLFKTPDPVRQWVLKLGWIFPDDITILAPFFLNLVHLKAGEAVYVAPGQLHAYLKGNAIELMANSDNSLRGGLTPKHIDLPELISITSFVNLPSPVLRPKTRKNGEKVYPTPAEEFQLSVIPVRAKQTFEGHTENRVAILICIKGFGRIRSSADRQAIPLRRGTVIIIPAAVEKYWIRGRAHIYKATVPGPSGKKRSAKGS